MLGSCGQLLKFLREPPEHESYCNCTDNGLHSTPFGVGRTDPPSQRSFRAWVRSVVLQSPETEDLLRKLGISGKSFGTVLLYGASRRRNNAEGGTARGGGRNEDLKRPTWRHWRDISWRRLLRSCCGRL